MTMLKHNEPDRSLCLEVFYFLCCEHAIVLCAHRNLEPQRLEQNMFVTYGYHVFQSPLTSSLGIHFK